MAGTILDVAGGYLLVGLIVGAVFLLWGIDRVDENARGAWVFRPLLIPGLALVWPLVLWRWGVLARGWDEARRHRPPRRAQDRLGVALALAVPLILLVALAVRQNGPFERPAELLDPPAEGTQ